jgi:hypothetical protein
MNSLAIETQEPRAQAITINEDSLLVVSWLDVDPAKIKKCIPISFRILI